jgi:hypothetical protein
MTTDTESDKAAEIKHLLEEQIETADRAATRGGVTVEGVAMTTDAETNEEFLNVVALASPNQFDDPVAIRSAVLSVLLSAYVPLVEAGFEYPLEAVVFLAVPDPPPVLATRTAVVWAREHIEDNLTLEQLLALVFETTQQPDDPETARDDWVPEYDLDWRQVDDPEPFGADVEYEYWSQGKVPYPEEGDRP